MCCMKLLGQRLMAQDFDRQVPEVQTRIAVLNGYAALIIPIVEAVGRILPSKVDVRSETPFCKRVSSMRMAI